jgi:hypothetical protein
VTPTPKLHSTDLHAETVASDISSPLSLGSTGNGQPPRGLALGGAFNETTEPTPAGGQQDYFELSVTPQPGYRMNTARFSMQIRRNDPDSKNSYSVYYGNDPGAGGNNFSTRLISGVITSEDVFETITVDVEGLPDFTNQTTALTFRVYAWGTVGLGTMWLDNIRVQASQTTASGSALAYYGDANRLLHPLDSLGNRIPDFSAAGYKNSNEPIPHVAGTIDPSRIVHVAPVAGDDMMTIQAAIDEVAAMTPDVNGFRGVIQLSAGEFQIHDQLLILESGIVLRGVGDGGDPAENTLLRGTGTSQRSLIVVGEAAGFATPVANTTHQVVDDYVPVGATSFQVDSTANWSVGDAIIVDRQSTANWISDIGMDMIPDDGDTIQWAAGPNFDQLHERVITRIEGNRIFLNAPLFGALEQRYGGGTAWRYTFPRINHVGIENIRGISDFVSSDDEAHAWTFIELQAVEDAWVTNVTGQHFGYATVHATGRAMRVTVDDAQSLDPVSIVTGGRRYPFTIDGQFILMRRLYSEDGRHDFVNNSAWRNRGPNVFLDGIAVNSNSSTGPHQRWSTGTLYDTITTDNIIEARNRASFGTGHGWAGANMVFWNTTATKFIVQNPPTAQNWVIGSSGQIVDETIFGPQPMGTYSEHETPIDFADPANPTSSLFVAQRNQADADSEAGLQRREYVLGDFDLGGFDGGSSDDAVYVDPAWSAEVAAFAGSAPIEMSDQTTAGHVVPFSFQYAIAPDEQVHWAVLTVGLRGTGGDTVNDVIHVDAASDARSLASLGLTSSLPTDKTTPVTLEITGSELELLNDGLLNLAISGNAALDWATLDLRVGPTLRLASIGDRMVDEGVELRFTAGTSDPDAPMNSLTFSLDAGAPSGASIDPSTGEFSWTPTEAQGPGTYNVTVRVTDDGTPNLEDFETIEIVVGEVNLPPVLASIGDRMVDEGVELRFTAGASDPDAPMNSLTFSLDAGAPSGASIHPNTGEFSWTPTQSQSPGTYNVTIRVTDDGTPSLDDAETIEIVVMAALDYGDAPTGEQSQFPGDYPVTRAQDGARHAASTLYLGKSFDRELDGRPDLHARGDDDDGAADEDGIRFLTTIVSSSEPTASSIEVISSQTGKLDAWIDFNRDGDWLDAGEQIFQTMSVSAGANVLPFSIPAGASAGQTFARFRLSSDGGLSPSGAADDGEVEDYTVMILDGASRPELTVSVALRPVEAGLGRDMIQIVTSTVILAQVPRSAVSGVTIQDDSGQMSARVDSSSGLSGVLSVGGDGGTNGLRLIGNQFLNLASLPQSAVQGIDEIALGEGDQHLALDVRRIIEAARVGSLRLVYGAEDAITVDDGWHNDGVELGGVHQLLRRITQLGVVVTFDGPDTHTNPIDPFDVNRNGSVSASDALVVINELAKRLFSEAASGAIRNPTADNLQFFLFYDTNRDRRITSLDALRVINELARRTNAGGEVAESEALLLTPSTRGPARRAPDWRNDSASVPTSSKETTGLLDTAPSPPPPLSASWVWGSRLVRQGDETPSLEPLTADAIDAVMKHVFLE